MIIIMIIVIIITNALTEILLDRKSLTDPQRSIVYESTYSFQQFFLIFLQVVLVYVRSSVIQSDARKVAGNDFETVLPTCDTLDSLPLDFHSVRKII